MSRSTELHVYDRDKEYIIAVGVPSFGAVSMAWHLAMLQLQTPLNRALRHIAVQGKEVGDARNEIVRLALDYQGELGDRVSHVLFIDDDVLVPPDAPARLLSHKLPIVAGLYYARTVAPQPLVLKDRYQGVADNLPSEGLYPCHGHGMGCTLIAREVFEALEPPWFKTTRDATSLSENAPTHWFQSEDMYFLERAREQGHQPTVDCGLFCWHYSLAEGVGYPIQKWKERGNGSKRTIQ